MPDQSCATLLKASVTGQSRSSSASTLRKASKSFPEDGSSSAPSHGSTAAGDWPKIGKNPSQVHRHGYSLHISEPSRVKLQGIVIMRRVLNQTLRRGRPELKRNAPYQARDQLRPAPLRSASTFWVSLTNRSTISRAGSYRVSAADCPKRWNEIGSERMSAAAVLIGSLSAYMVGNDGNGPVTSAISIA